MSFSVSRKGAGAQDGSGTGQQTDEKYEYGQVNELPTSDARAELEAARRNTRPPGELP